MACFLLAEQTNEEKKSSFLARIQKRTLACLFVNSHTQTNNNSIHTMVRDQHTTKNSCNRYLTVVDRWIYATADNSPCCHGWEHQKNYGTNWMSLSISLLFPLLTPSRIRHAIIAISLVPNSCHPKVNTQHPTSFFFYYLPSALTRPAKEERSIWWPTTNL